MNFPFDIILAWYEKNGRHELPWRQIYGMELKDRLYKVWIAEVMLQQTQVDRVIGYYTRFLLKYPTIDSLAATTYDELFPYYQGLGYYWRARRMITLAQAVVTEYGWIFPDNFEKLRKLPGIGAYTAQAILAFGYDQPVLAMDANLVKIFGRYYFGDRKATLPPELMDSLLKQLKEECEKNPQPWAWSVQPLTLSGRTINNALMDFGALVSTSFEKLDREKYPLRDCVWFKTEWKIEVENKKNNSKKTPFLKGDVRQSGQGDLWENKSSAPQQARGTSFKKEVKKHACLVFLHEAHKVYWSSAASHYEPFLIEPTSTDDRRTVQDYFSAAFELEVSVRPSFWSGVFEWIPVKLFHAQIQTGTLKQKTFPKVEKEKWMSEHLEVK